MKNIIDDCCWPSSPVWRLRGNVSASASALSAAISPASAFSSNSKGRFKSSMSMSTGRINVVTNLFGYVRGKGFVLLTKFGVHLQGEKNPNDLHVCIVVSPSVPQSLISFSGRADVNYLAWVIQVGIVAISMAST